MTSGLDMSLDDLIKSNKKSAPTLPRGRGSAAGPGPARRGPNRSANRAAPYASGKPVKAPETAWKHDMYANQLTSQAPLVRNSAIETGTKLYISNLEYGVSNEDIKVGDLKRFSIHYDRSGRSKGTAEVVFSRRNDAVAAVKRYNNVQLDGKPMKIEIVGTNVVTPAHATQPTNGILATPNNIFKSGSARIGLTGAPRGGGPISGRGVGRGRGRGRGGRGRGRGRSDPVSAEDLDADLEKYHSSAMQIN